MPLATHVGRSSPPNISKPNPDLVAVFRRINAQNCPHLYNFHLHTTASDGQLSPETLVDQALDVGLIDFAITDHHSVEGYFAAQADLNQRDVPCKPRIWSGIEITASLLDVEVHILGFGFNATHPALEPYLQGTAPTGTAATAKIVIQQLHQAGAITVLAHPARYKRPATELIPAAVELGIAGVETYYAYGNPHPWVPTPHTTDLVGGFAQRYGLLETCGTDTHGLNILGRI
ncbi:PHP domain-containing protein [Synechococcus sp. PCC 6312]|uniref:PHP domain-containing protein n=1 Tax=Synechococcus sp. (strain ATCC 27167 / PCC 6312) TaxID=195253 RepID=UPI00029EFD67|nr:PHP domain-containing protein [Synechococcus sp. PCC 6312]AFY60993.1 putative metal-dependent phosphoesterase, PHP family [Synechococcus sp. PCC 6312]